MKLDFLKEKQREFLKKGNYHSHQTVEERYGEIINRVKDYEEVKGVKGKKGYPEGLSKRLKKWIELNYISLSSPCIANFGKVDTKTGELSKNLSASCNIITVEDSIHDIYNCNLEVAMLSKRGAGIGIHSDLISNTGTLIDDIFYSNKKLDWVEALIDTSQKVSQGGVRRGYATPFESIESKDLSSLFNAVDKNNPDSKGVLVDNTVGINVPRGFMDKVKSGEKDYQLKWLETLKVRQKSGNAYICFEENMNKNCSPIYKKLGLNINRTNICTEFVQPHISGYTPVCVIGALNLIHWDIIKNNPQIIKDLVYFLDINNEEYVYLSEGQKGLEKAHRSAKERRDIGLGTLGFHSLLQSKMMAFGDVASRQLNKEIYSTIEKYAVEATEELADILGPAPMAEKAGFNRRNCSLMMIAPNKSTSFLCTIDEEGTPASLGIEPYFSNYHTKRLAKIQTTFKNPFLKKLLQDKGKDTFEIWESISDNLGSVKHLDFLSEEEKNVFLTFAEISPKDIIDLASDRQKYIDMGQSLNLVNRPNYTLKDLNEIHMYAFDKGIKTLYYFYPQAHAALEKDGAAWDDCVSCAD